MTSQSDSAEDSIKNNIETCSRKVITNADDVEIDNETVGLRNLCSKQNLPPLSERVSKIQFNAFIELSKQLLETYDESVGARGSNYYISSESAQVNEVIEANTIEISKKDDAGMPTNAEKQLNAQINLDIPPIHKGVKTYNVSMFRNHLNNKRRQRCQNKMMSKKKIKWTPILYEDDNENIKSNEWFLVPIIMLFLAYAIYISMGYLNEQRRFEQLNPLIKPFYIFAYWLKTFVP